MPRTGSRVTSTPWAGPTIRSPRCCVPRPHCRRKSGWPSALKLAKRGSGTWSPRPASPASAARPRRRSTSSSRLARDRDGIRPVRGRPHRDRALPAAGPDRPMDTEMTGPGREPSRARYPDDSGYIKRGDVRLYYEVYGSGEPTVFLLPTWSVVHSRHWKMQIPYLTRHCRVLTFDGRGNGRSDRPAGGYGENEFAADALAVMDATATERAVLVSLSAGASWALLLAAEQPDRVSGAAFIGPGVSLAALPA